MSGNSNNGLNNNLGYFSMCNSQPWSNFEEWKVCYDSLFNNKYVNVSKDILLGETIYELSNRVEENLDTFINNLDYERLLVANDLLQIWKIRNESTNLTLTTSLLLEEIINLKTKAKNSGKMTDDPNHVNTKLIIDHSSDIHTLSQKIIRVTNLLIDDLKKKNRNLSQNMFLVAKEIGLPEFIIEIRHACTHKILPKCETLVYMIKYLYHWIKENIWDKQYSLYVVENKLFIMIQGIIDDISNLNIDKSKSKNKNKKKIENRISDFETKLYKDEDMKVNFDIDHLFIIAEKLVVGIFNNISIDKSKNLNSVNLINSDLYKTAFSILIGNHSNKNCVANNTSIAIVLQVLIFKFISDQITIFVKNNLKCDSNKQEEIQNNLNAITDEENTIAISKLSYISSFIIKYSNFNKTSNNDIVCLFDLIKSILNNLKFAKDFSSEINTIYNNFLIFIKSNVSDKEKEGILKDVFDVGNNLKNKMEINSQLKERLLTKEGDSNYKNGVVNDGFYFNFPPGNLLLDQLDYLSKGGEPDSFYKNKEEDIHNKDKNNDRNIKQINENTDESDEQYLAFLHHYFNQLQDNSLVFD